MYVLSTGFPGRKKSTSMAWKCAYASKWFEVNSVPFSTRIILGIPRFANTRSSASITDRDGRVQAIFNAKHSRVKLSITVNTRISLSSESESATKSRLHRSLTRAGLEYGRRASCDVSPAP